LAATLQPGRLDSTIYSHLRLAPVQGSSGLMRPCRGASNSISATLPFVIPYPRMRHEAFDPSYAKGLGWEKGSNVT
jgi:hypothetical protein